MKLNVVFALLGKSSANLTNRIPNSSWVVSPTAFAESTATFPSLGDHVSCSCIGSNQNIALSCYEIVTWVTEIAAFPWANKTRSHRRRSGKKKGHGHCARTPHLPLMFLFVPDIALGRPVGDKSR